MYNLPKDWEFPEWGDKTLVHNWKNYVNQELKDNWFVLEPKLKQILAVNFEEIADNEEWD